MAHEQLSPMNVCNKLTPTSHTQFKMRASEFLSALPESVIKDGQVVQVRAGIAEKLSVSDNQRKPGSCYRH